MPIIGANTLVSEKTIGRLTLYRRIVSELTERSIECIHSHQLALRAGSTAAQVRRDLMVVGTEGSPKRGYKCCELLKSLAAFLDQPEGHKVALVGVGNLGRSLLSHFIGRRPSLEIVAAFDANPQIAGTSINGCPCHAVDELEHVIQKEKIKTAILAVPVLAAQLVADRLCVAGIKGIVNFAPVPLHVSPSVFVENLDLTMSLEKVAFFASKRT